MTPLSSFGWAVEGSARLFHTSCVLNRADLQLQVAAATEDDMH